VRDRGLGAGPLGVGGVDYNTPVKTHYFRSTEKIWTSGANVIVLRWLIVMIAELEMTGAFAKPRLFEKDGRGFLFAAVGCS